MGISRGKFFDWKKRYGKVNEHNGKVPRDNWLLAAERQAIIDYFDQHPTEGYRRLTYMMIDDNAVFASPTSVYRVLREAGRLDRWPNKASKKGTGFVQPLTPHAHWHVDVAYLNLGGTFYYLCSVLDGYSRLIVHWEIREAMKEADVECIVQRAREKFPDAKPRIISDNGPQFIAKDFKEFVRVSGMSHVRITPGYPQSNGKIERYHRTIKSGAIRAAAPTTLAEARSVVERFVAHYNDKRLHSALGYVAPRDYLDGLAPKIQAERDRKLDDARAVRAKRRAAERAEVEATARQYGATKIIHSEPSPAVLAVQ